MEFIVKVMVLGANGFIGSHIVAGLVTENHEVVCAVRDLAAGRKRFPTLEVVHCDFSELIDLDSWKKILNSVDIVINCIDVLHTHRRVMQKVHVDNPKALFMACQTINKRLIHLSAMGIDKDNSTDYANGKLIAEKLLSGLNFPWIILKLSLVIANGSHGITSLLRGISAFPGFIPLVGDGQQKLQPIFIKDVVKCISTVIDKNSFNKEKLEITGPNKLTLKQIVTITRDWLAEGKAKFIPVPIFIMRVVCKLGDLFKLGSINTTTLKLCLSEQTSSRKDIEKLGITSTPIERGLAEQPSCVQDLWQAKLYFAKPLLQFILAFFWLVSGLIPMMSLTAQRISFFLFELTGLNSQAVIITFWVSCTWQVLLGLWVLSGRAVRLGIKLQLITIIYFTALFTYIAPHLWLDPMGGLMKNITVLICILIYSALSKER